MMHSLLLMLAFLSGQEADGIELPAHILKNLQSDNEEARHQAVVHVLRMGKDAERALERIRKGSDKALATKASLLKKALEVQSALTANTAKHLPSLSYEIAKGGGRGWSRSLFQFFEDISSPSKPAWLTRADLSPLVGPALAESLTTEEEVQILRLSARFRVPGIGREVLPYLDDASFHVRSAALEVLVLLAYVPATVEVRRCLNDDHPTVRARACEFLGVVGDRESLPILINLCDATSYPGREAILAAGRMKSPLATPHLLTLLQNPVPAIRGRAADLLVTNGAPDTATPLLEGLAHSTVPAHAEVIRVVAALGSDDTRHQVADLLGHAAPAVRVNALNTLRAMRATEYIDTVSKRLGDTSPEVRQLAVVTMAHLCGKQADRRIVEALNDEHPQVSSQASESLIGIGDPVILDNVLPLLKSDSVHTLLSAIKIIGSFRDSSAIPALVSLLDHPKMGVRRASILALGELRATPASDSLLRTATSMPDLRYEAVHALARANDKDVVPTLLELARNAPPGMRRHIGRALCALGDARGVPLALKGATSSNAEILFTLNRIRTPQLYERARCTVLTSAPKGSPMELLKIFASQLGVAIKVNVQTPEGRPGGKRIRSLLGTHGGNYSILDGLETIVKWMDHELVLNDTSIEVLHREKALHFWTTWRDSQD